VHRVDGRLDLVWAGIVAAQALANDLLAFGDEGAIPARAVLVSEQDQAAARTERSLLGSSASAGIR